MPYKPQSGTNPPATKSSAADFLLNTANVFLDTICLLVSKRHTNAIFVDKEQSELEGAVIRNLIKYLDPVSTAPVINNPHDVTKQGIL